jgi:transposase
VERRALAKLLDEGLSLEEIGRRFGKDHSTVGYWVRKYGLVANGRAKYAPRGGIRRDELARAVESELTIEQMARVLGRSASTVQYWLRKHGLKTARARRSLIHDGSGEAMGRCRRHGLVRLVRSAHDGYHRCTRCRSDDVARRRRRVKELLVREAGGRCHLCGYERYMGALHFHHIDPASKEFALSHAGVTRAIAAAREEARKCVLLCSNCHAEVEGGIVQLHSQVGTTDGVPHLDGPG